MSDLQQDNQEYYGSINEPLAETILRTKPQAVLEIGCGSGALGARLKSVVPGLQWDGIELFPAAAVKAKSVLDRVFEGSIEEFDLDPLAATYDTIVMGDVLEHLINPWSALKRLAGILRRNGNLCMSVPNVNHWSIFYALTTGRFPYAESGLLDRTHLRFFTRTELEQSIIGAGLRVSRLESIINQHPKMNPFIDNYLKFQSVAEIPNPDLAIEMKTFQWVITASK